MTQLTRKRLVKRSCKTNDKNAIFNKELVAKVEEKSKKLGFIPFRFDKAINYEKNCKHGMKNTKLIESTIEKHLNLVISKEVNKHNTLISPSGDKKSNFAAKIRP